MTGDELKAALEAKNCSVTGFARSNGINRRTVIRWCALGTREVPPWVPRLVTYTRRRPTVLSSRAPSSV